MQAPEYQTDRKSAQDDAYAGRDVSVHLKPKAAGIVTGHFLKHGVPAPPPGSGLATTGMPTPLEMKREIEKEKLSVCEELAAGRDVTHMLTFKPRKGVPLPSPELIGLFSMWKRYRDVVLGEVLLDNLEIFRPLVEVSAEPCFGSRMTKPRFAEDLRHHGGVNGYWINWPGVNTNTSAPTILYIHCGFGYSGSTMLSFGYLERLSRQTNMRVLSVDYRLCPENSIHDSAEDVFRAYNFLVKHCKVDPQSIMITGEDIGGTLGCMTLQRMARENVPQPAAMWTCTPICTIDEADDSTFRQKVYERNENAVFSEHAFSHLHYTRGKGTGKEIKPRDPTVNPLYMDMKGVTTPILFTVPGFSALEEESLVTARKFKEANVDITVRRVPHGGSCINQFDVPEGIEELAFASSWASRYVKL